MQLCHSPDISNQKKHRFGEENKLLRRDQEAEITGDFSLLLQNKKNFLDMHEVAISGDGGTVLAKIGTLLQESKNWT